MNFHGYSSGAMRRGLRFRILGDEGKRKKCFVLANDLLTGDSSLHELSVSKDMIHYAQMGVELSSAWSTLFTENYKGALNLALLDKSLHQKLWDDSPYFRTQLPHLNSDC